MTAFLVILLLAALGFGGWKARRRFRKTGALPPPAVPPTPAFVEPVAQYESRTVTLKLPSLEPMFQFSCDIVVHFRTDRALPNGQDPRDVAEWLVYESARRISLRYPLDNRVLLQTELDLSLRTPATELGRLLDVRAQCSSISVDEEELRLVGAVARRRFALETENRLEGAYRTRVGQLSAIFADPRSAALWWFAHHPDKIDELPDKIKLMFAIDRHLDRKEGDVDFASFDSPDPVRHRIGADLEEFLAGADVSSKAAIGTVLGSAYERLGRVDLAEHARTLAEPIPEEGSDGNSATAGPAS